MKNMLYTLCLLATFGCSQQSKESVESNLFAPNIIWIIAEDLSPDIGCYGNSQVKTTTLDDLANHGIRYMNAYATGAACSPSRTALATGYYQNAIGAHHMRYPDHLKPDLEHGVLPIHTLLENHGYQTANIRSYPGNGKTDWLFKYDTDTYEHQHWDSIDNEKPFFARICLGLTHRGFARDTISPVNPDEVKLPPYYPDHPVSKKDWAYYFESIQVLDKQVARIIKDLEKNNLLENAIIFFFSDHGRPMTRAKNYLYESGLKVPLIISSYDPAIKRKYLSYKDTDERLLSLIDVNATTLALAGLSSYNSQGIPFLDEPLVEIRNQVFGAADRTGETFFKSRSVRSGDLKYIRNYHHDFSVNETATAYRKANHPIYHLLNILKDRGELDAYQSRLLQPMDPEELYDLKNDPYELNNLATQSEWTEKLESMRVLLDHWMEQIDDKGTEEDPPEIVAAFESYGINSIKQHKKAIERLERAVKAEVEKQVK
ncbi:sulfatase [Fulvivirgaceae bacterium BMA10]|uniref:Sulfatase n=1 Tax=Splendidivirga corallicola TaxID=3051826 RepID=A0ABT8KHZ6_9BACT|nr:sulfatase [Fulvivirgaceae bacterium BMA10]